MEKTKSIIKTDIKHYDITRPAEVQRMAVVLKNYVIDNNLYATIKDKKYVMVEGWQFAGALVGTSPMVGEPKNLSTGLEIKYQVAVDIIDTKTDKVIGRGFAVCSNKESLKRSFDEYAVMSMAQTRAIGKAYRNIMGWVMKLAGYESTPAEEIKPNNINQTILLGDVEHIKKETREERLEKYIKGINSMTSRKELAVLRNKIVSSNKSYKPEEKTSILKAIDERYAKV